MRPTDGPVLLAYDGSENAATAIGVAGALLPGRTAVVCHVRPGRTDADAAAGVAADGVEIARRAGFDAAPLVEHEHRRTWRALLDAAARSDATIVVTGAHGRSGMRRAVLGSVSTGLVHHSRLPVLVVPGTTTMDMTRGPVLACYDGSAGAKHAVAVAGGQLGPRKALVLHLWESWITEAPALAGASGTVQGMAAELDEDADEQSEERAAEGVDLAQRAGLDADGLSERAAGPTWKALLDAADEHACAAIIVGSRGLTGISAALGSVSNGVVHHSRRPVLVVPEEEEQ